jgi:uncharacterized protein with HEPN domain
MSRDDAVLVDMLGAAKLAAVFAEESDLTAFMSDRKTQSAVLHQLLVLGEAVKRLSDQLRASTPGVPWKLVAGMRDKLIHHYDNVDLEEVWRTVHSDIPALINQLEDLVPRDNRRQ